VEKERVNQISFKKIAIAVAVIFALSRTRQIVEFFKDLDLGGILTLEPLRRTPEEGRFLVTVAVGVLVVVVLWSLVKNRK